MSKALFRYLRGEINGFYLTSIHNTLNNFTANIKKFFVEFKAQQFSLDKMSEETVLNLGRFASIFIPRQAINDLPSSLYLTESEIVDEKQYSERGLFELSTESFKFYHTDDETTEDINNLATTTLRSSMTGEEQTKGYIADTEEDVLDDNGNIRSAKIKIEPPANTAYSDYKGNQFLFLSEGNTYYTNISSSLYIELYKILQYIRYNGTSIQSLAKIVSIVCPNGFVKIHHISVGDLGTYLIAWYTYDNTVEIASKAQRLFLLEYIINLKFNQVILKEYTGE